MSDRAFVQPCMSLVLAAALSGLPSAARAATTSALSLGEMVQMADTIVIGRAVAAQSQRVGRNVYTRYRIQVQEDLLGAGQSELSVVVPGGVDQSGPHPLVFSVGDAPVLQRDAPVALLLQRDAALGTSDHRIVGFNQGHIDLAVPAAGAERSELAAPKRLQQVRTRLQGLIAARAAAQPPGTARSLSAPTPAPASAPRLPGRATIILGR